MWRQTFEWDFRQTFGKLWYTTTKDLGCCMISVINRMHPFAKVNSSMKGSSGTKIMKNEHIEYDPVWRKKWTWFNENIAYKKSNDMNVTRWKIIFNSMLREKSSTPCWGLLEMCWLNLPCRFGWLKILSFTWRFYQALKTLDLLEVVGEKKQMVV